MQVRSRWLIAAVFIAGLGYAAIPARARPASENRVTPQASDTRTRVEVTIPVQSLETYVSCATRIVRGRVVAQREQKTPNEIDMTVVWLDVTDTLKGKPSNFAEIVVAGSLNADGRGTLVKMAPRFHVGDEVVLFLWDAGEGSPTGILGLSHGTYSIDGESVRGLHAGPEQRTEDFLRDIRKLVKKN